ncbi:MAG: MBOAT family protein [Alphaproteobacteria bacterium]|nr:MBOAT family protein [Alphaproteobacteria bacterium]
MIFNSVSFILFLAAFTSLWWMLPERPRHWLIFLGSLLFYGFWRVEFVAVLLLSMSTDYAAALALDRTTTRWKRRALLSLSVLVNLGLLTYFKYADFLLSNFAKLSLLTGFDLSVTPLNIVLPLGISFYTFQSISYTVDVYRRQVRAERDYLCFANFVLFFPQLVAGPILRAAEVIEQLKSRQPFRLFDLSFGIKTILSGMFLKVVLADNLAPLVDDAFSMPSGSFGAKESWALASLFGYQIYFDFAGYSLIAIGSARLMGVHFPANFDWPYISRSPREFWRRWHISLSSWIRDYLYLPLCGMRTRDDSLGGLAEVAQQDVKTREGKRIWALLVTWAIMGLWHGANWTFVLWGLWHAVLILGYRLLTPRLVLPRPLAAIGGWLVTYPLILLGWIPFRAQSVSEAVSLMINAFTPSSYLLPFALPRHYYTLSLLLPLAMVTAYILHVSWPRLRRLPVVGDVMHIGGLAFAFGLVFVFFRPIRQFIYFQF